MVGGSRANPRQRALLSRREQPAQVPCCGSRSSQQLTPIPIPRRAGLSALLAYYKRKFWDAAVDGPAGQVARPLSDRLVAAAAVSAREFRCGAGWGGGKCGWGNVGAVIGQG